jgi:hypothetical protein
MALPERSGSIAGVVRDTSGAVLPGVTIEASSPVLIEKSRTAVSDDTGRYRIPAVPIQQRRAQPDHDAAERPRSGMCRPA